MVLLLANIVCVFVRSAFDLIFRHAESSTMTTKTEWVFLGFFTKPAQAGALPLYTENRINGFLFGMHNECTLFTLFRALRRQYHIPIDDLSDVL